ncbi:MAG: 3-oxoacyl-[acyl-carrier-protein] synthase III C-terminal domain-containing protein [Bacteroidota bacterium]
MAKIRAAITGVNAFLPDYRLTNEKLSTMVDTTDEWIMQRIGIKERRILKEEGKATSDMGAEAVKGLLEKTGTSPAEIDLLICATITPDMPFPATANIIAHKADIHNAWSFYHLEPRDIAWLVPHQANMRIIEATARRMGLEKEKVMINIQKYGNTTAATIPLCLWDFEKQLKKGDNVILAAFGAGFTWGSVFLKWAYNS